MRRSTNYFFYKNCEYEHLLDGIIRDRLIEGIGDNGFRRRLLREDKLTLGTCIDVCLLECTRQQMLNFTGTEESSASTVHAVAQGEDTK